MNPVTCHTYAVTSATSVWHESLLTSTTFLMCLFTTHGSGLVVMPEAQSSGARGLLGVVGDVGCEDRYMNLHTQNLHQQRISYTLSIHFQYY